MKNTNKNLKYTIFMGLLLAGVVGIISLSGCIDKSIKKECESVDDYASGSPNIVRSDASNHKVFGMFGCRSEAVWYPDQPAFRRYDKYSPTSGYLKYKVEILETSMWNISIRYSCNNVHSVPIVIYIDGEQEPRAKFYPENTHDWNSFKDTGKINMGSITAGSHSIVFKTDGVKYGVADLDYFVLSIQS